MVSLDFLRQQSAAERLPARVHQLVADEYEQACRVGPDVEDGGVRPAAIGRLEKFERARYREGFDIENPRLEPADRHGCFEQFDIVLAACGYQDLDLGRIAFAQVLHLEVDGGRIGRIGEVVGGRQGDLDFHLFVG